MNKWSDAEDAANAEVMNFLPGESREATLCYHLRLLSRAASAFELPTQRLGAFLRPGGDWELGSKVRKLLLASGVIGPVGPYPPRYQFLREDVPAERPLDAWLAACNAAPSSPADFFPGDSRLNLALAVCRELSRTNNPFVLPIQKLTTARALLVVLVREGTPVPLHRLPT
jgi:hypothetical protein